MLYDEPGPLVTRNEPPGHYLFREFRPATDEFQSRLGQGLSPRPHRRGRIETPLPLAAAITRPLFPPGLTAGGGLKRVEPVT